MNICIIRHAYFPDDPTVRKEALAILEAGHSVDIICLKRKGQCSRDTFNGVNVFRIPLGHKRTGILRYFFEYALSFFMMTAVTLFLFLQNRYDCIQVNTMPDFLVFTTVIPKIMGAKILLHLHEPTPELWITKYGSNHLRFFLNSQIKIEQLAIRYVDRALTVTDALRRRFVERGANIEKITVIPNVCEEGFNPDIQNRKSISNKYFRLITHGLIEERYGHEVIIRAVNNLKARLPNLYFDILGDGEYKNVVSELINALGCADRVRLLGYVSFGELLQKLRDADIGIVAMKRTPYSELVDTTKMYEYIALHKPIIVSRLPAVEETFDDSCVMFFEPGNPEDLARCIVDFYNNPEKRQRLAQNAYHRYQEIRWTETKKIYLSVIENPIKKKNY